MHSILVQDYMDHNPHAIPSGMNVRDAVEALLSQGIIGAPVVDDNEQVVGFVSEQDCIKEMLNDAFYCEEPPEVNTVMHTDVALVRPQTSIVEVAQSIQKYRHKNYPVVEGEKLVGIITRSDILRALMENDEDCYLHH